MIPMTVHGLLPLPQDVLESPGHLPWPEGSIISGKIEPTSDPQQSLLLIGGYRLLAHVPPNIPKQSIWLQLIDANLPARFRLLTKAQAESEITRMLHEHVEKTDSKQPAPLPTHTEQPSAFSQPDTPYHFVPVSLIPPRWLITDRHDEHAPRGMLKGETNAQGFQLRGRLDLKNLGPVSFAISGASNNIKLSLFATSLHGYEALKHDFSSWLSNQKAVMQLDGNLHQGSIEDETNDTRLA